MHNAQLLVGILDTLSLKIKRFAFSVTNVQHFKHGSGHAAAGSFLTPVFMESIYIYTNVPSHRLQVTN